MQIYVLRHNESVANYEDKLPELNTPLTERGIEYTSLIAEYLLGKKVEVIYSSPLERALQTSKIISDKIGVDIVQLPGLSDMDYGEMAGRDPDESEVYQIIRQLKKYDPEFRFPGGGNYLDLQTQVQTAINEILNSGRDIVATVGHRDSNRIFLGSMLDMTLDDSLDIEQGNTEIYLFDTITKEVTNIRIRKGLRIW